MQILDIGGGTGEIAELALIQGHKVRVNDISADAIALAQDKLASYSDVDFVVSDLQDIECNKVDMVFCHAVLEWTKDPAAVIAKIVSCLKPGGLLSLSFFNRDAAIFGNALYGNFDFIERGLDTKNAVRLNPHNPQYPRDVLAMLADNNATILSTAGIRCFHDYLRERQHQIDKYDALLALEQQYCDQEPYKWLGRYFHVIAQLPETEG